MNRDIRSVEDVLRLLDRLFPPDADRDKPAPFFVSKPDENLASWIDQGLIQPGRALDVGCGRGRNALYLASRGFTVDAVDLSPAAIAWARDRAGGAEVTFHCGNVFDLTLAGAYDLVYDSGCFHHLPPHRRISYLDFLNRALAPGGHFGLVCFAEDADGSELDDIDLYRQGGLGGGLAYTAESLSSIFDPLTELEQRPMIEQPGESPLFGKSFLRTALFRSGLRRAAGNRAEVLRGLLAIADRRRELIDALWETADPAQTQEAVQRVLGVGERQARAVLDLQLRRLTPWQMAIIRRELGELEQ